MRLFIFCLSIIFLSGCASVYNSINPSYFSFHPSDTSSLLNFSYRYNILDISGNNKYANREKRNDVYVVAVEITNKSTKEINTNSIRFYTGNVPLTKIENTHAFKETKQKAWPYLLYNLLIYSIPKTNSDGDVTSVSIVPLGIPISIINIITVANANKKYNHELQQYNLNNKIIKPGEIIKAIVSFYGANYEPIRIDYFQ